MINEELAVIHSGKYLHMGFRTEFEQVFRLRLGHKVP